LIQVSEEDDDFPPPVETHNRMNGKLRRVK
jgi:hypothetical protein